MQKRYREFWRGLGGVEKSFLFAALAYGLLRLTGLSATWQLIAALATFILGFVSLVRYLRRAMRKAIWRLRNRLIVAYLFIAVVPIVLILSLAVLGYWVLVGQMAAYFVRTDLANRERSIMNTADMFAGYRYGGRGGRGLGPGRGFGGRGEAPPDARRQPPQAQGGPTPQPGRGPEIRGGRFPFPAPATPREAEEFLRDSVNRYHERPGNADNEILITGPYEIRVPADSKLAPPSAAWGRTSGLVLKTDGDTQRLYLWAHSQASGGEVREATILEPLTKDVLSGPLPTLGDVSVSSLTVPYVREQPSRIPKRANALDLWVRGYYPVQIYSWDNPQEQWGAMLLVDTRMSAVLGIIFEQKPGQPVMLTDFVQVAFIVITGLFLIVELLSLRAGVQLSRSITGSVHELYQGTQHVKEGDFAHRIPVKGDDQLAELSSSFNTMTENLGQLIVVAKEKERLQSELE
ncbi:MAG: HAMP domain-containing protein, partial [Acidobacteriia bacterium]|nr:HAMP domain-containing protein [Terriglobia bacterium]